MILELPDHHAGCSYHRCYCGPDPDILRTEEICDECHEYAGAETPADRPCEARGCTVHSCDDCAGSLLVDGTWWCGEHRVERDQRETAALWEVYA